MNDEKLDRIIELLESIDNSNSTNVQSSDFSELGDIYNRLGSTNELLGEILKAIKNVETAIQSQS